VSKLTIEESIEINEDEIIKKFEDFLLNFRIPDKEGKSILKYREKLIEAVSDDLIRSLVIDYNDLVLYYPELGEFLVKKPKIALKLFNKSLRNVLRQIRDDLSDSDLRNYVIRIKNIGGRARKEVQIRDIYRAENLGKILMFRGIVVKATKVKPILRRAYFRCMVCGYIFPKEFEDVFEKPESCENPACENTTKFELLKEGQEFEEFQELTVQELPEELPPGQLPQGIPVYVRGDLAGKIRPGDRVSLTGIVDARPEGQIRPGRRPLYTVYVNAVYLETESGISEEVKLTDLEKQKIIAMRDDPDLENKIIASIAPSIYGYDHIKKAVSALLFGGVPKQLSDGTKIRGTINILMVGDPGTGKSQILKYVSQIAPRAIYTSGKGASAAGLTAAVVRTEDEWTLEAGVLVLSDRGIACIDEFDKMSRDDRRALHEAMEQQTISIAKAGIVATLNARTSILSAANPKFGRYIPDREISENIDLPPTILSRFDLIFIFTDKPDREKDQKMAKHILGLHTKEINPTPPLPPDFLKKYILYAREYIQPKLTKRAAEKIMDFYIKMRESSKTQEEESLGLSPIAITARQLEALVRLTEAHARMLLKEEADEIDADFAIELMRTSLTQVARDPLSGRIDVDIVTTGISHRKRSNYMIVLDIIRNLEKKYPDGVPENVIFEEAGKNGISKQFVARVINQEKNRGHLIEPKNGRYRLISI